MTQGKTFVLKNMTQLQKSLISGKIIKEFNGLIIDEDISQIAFTNKYNSKRHMSEKLKQTLNETRHQNRNSTGNGFEQTLTPNLSSA